MVARLGRGLGLRRKARVHNSLLAQALELCCDEVLPKPHGDAPPWSGQDAWERLVLSGTGREGSGQETLNRRSHVWSEENQAWQLPDLSRLLVLA